MTLYVADETSRALTVVRVDYERTSVEVLCAWPPSAPEAEVLRLADALTCIVVTVEEACIRPSNRLDRELTLLEGITRVDQLAQLLVAVDGGLRVPDPPEVELQPCYDPAERAAHRAGRALRALDDDHLAKAVIGHVAQELRTVIHAAFPAAA